MKFSIPFAASVGTSFLLTFGLAAPLDLGNHTAVHTTSLTAASTTTTTTVTIVFDGRPAAVTDWRPSHPHALNPLSTPTTSPNATILLDARNPRRVWKPSHPDHTKPLSTPTSSTNATTFLAPRSPRMVWPPYDPDTTKPISTPTASANSTSLLEARSPMYIDDIGRPYPSRTHFNQATKHTTLVLKEHSSTKTMPQVSGAPALPAIPIAQITVTTQITVTQTTFTSSPSPSTSPTPQPTTSNPCPTRVPKFKSWGPRTTDICYHLDNLASVVTETQYIKCDALCTVENFWLEAGRGGQVHCKTWLPGTFTATTTVCTTDATATPTGA